MGSGLALHKKYWTAFALLVIVAITLRLMLPSAIKLYALSRINQIPQYQVAVGDIDVHLWHGSYDIKKIVLTKVRLISKALQENRLSNYRYMTSILK